MTSTQNAPETDLNGHAGNLVHIQGIRWGCPPYIRSACPRAVGPTARPGRLLDPCLGTLRFGL